LDGGVERGKKGIVGESKKQSMCEEDLVLEEEEKGKYKGNPEQ